MKSAANTPARSRPRKKTTAPVEAPPNPRNVNELEGGLSLVCGVLLVIAASFPRSFKQLLLLSLGGGLVYRGMTGHCGLYQATGIDTAKEPLLPQINAKILRVSENRARNAL